MRVYVHSKYMYYAYVYVYWCSWGEGEALFSGNGILRRIPRAQLSWELREWDFPSANRTSYGSSSITLIILGVFWGFLSLVSYSILGRISVICLQHFTCFSDIFTVGLSIFTEHLKNTHTHKIRTRRHAKNAGNPPGPVPTRPGTKYPVKGGSPHSDICIYNNNSLSLYI